MNRSEKYRSIPRKKMEERKEKHSNVKVMFTAKRNTFPRAIDNYTMLSASLHCCFNVYNIHCYTYHIIQNLLKVGLRDKGNYADVTFSRLTHKCTASKIFSHFCCRFWSGNFVCLSFCISLLTSWEITFKLAVVP